MDYTMRRSRTHRALDAIVSDILERQHGAISRQQAREQGFTDRMIDWRVNRGRWEPVDFGVYRVAGDPETRWQRLMAACLAGPAVASHRAAGILWNVPSMPEEIVEVTALRHRRRRASDVIWHESYHLADRDVTEIEGIPVTRPVRTFLDLGAVLSAAVLEEVLDDGRRRNLLDIPAIWRRLEQLGDLRPGAMRVRRVLESRVAGDRPSESVLETRFRQLLRNADLPIPTAQFEIRVGSGSIARVDFAYPELSLAIELDGAAYHSSERAKRRDRSRENELVALGWRVLRFTWEDVRDRPTAVVSDLRCVHGLRSM
jgi:very-short-patch-repair endonuclease